MTDFVPRPGESALRFDPDATAADARLVFIGRVRSPWTTLEACPKNLREARERGGGGHIEIVPDFRPGLDGLAVGAHILLLAWLDRARRDLIKLSPRHVDGPRGVFSLRAPLRPNPIAVDVVRIVGIDATAGRIDVDAIDLVDGTPLIDIKPYLASIDAVAG